MPYYVYAIHTDSNINRLYDSFVNFNDAENLEKEMKMGRSPGDNYVVQMIYAEDDVNVKRKISEFRKEHKLPPS
ncbi:hypothetical protein [Halopseudomonas sp.]|uniref:hypothetical protein n=1 Tax=Halopseudomonas sp. TaxID=2901191 RepID=UPI003000FC13